VGDSQSEIDYEGTTEGLELIWSAGDLIATGSAAPTEIDGDNPGGFTVNVTTPEFYGNCSIRTSEGGENERSGPEEEELAESSNCPGFTPISSGPSLEPIEVTPGSGLAGEGQTLTSNGSAAVAENIASGVDLVTRPLIDGAMIFTAIRDASGPTEYEWQVHVHPDQELQLVDAQHAQVVYKGGGPTAFSITVVKAHDAIGTSVPTTINVVGNSVILTVNHSQNGPNGAPYIYPVVAGAGWEGGFRTVEVVVDTGEEASEVSGSAVVKNHFVEANYGPPEVGGYAGEPLAAQQTSDLPTRKRKYNFRDCGFKVAEQTEPGRPPEPAPRVSEEQMSQACHGSYYEGYWTLEWGVSVHGWYYFKPHKLVWTRNPPQCEKWGPGKLPALVHCLPGSASAPSTTPIDTIGDYRFAPHTFGEYGGQNAVCFRINGVLPKYWKQAYPGEKVLEEYFHKYRGMADKDEKCDWGHLEKSQ